MNIDILNMKRFDKNENAIDIALPVWVVECEATPPIKNHLDAYETATLKLVNLGLSMNGIAKTLYATESLVEDILHSLEYKELVCKERSRSWEMTNRGDQFLKGNMQEKESDHSVFGLMFVNAIRKNVLPFFYDGDIGQISLFDGERLPEKLSLENNESKTFGNPGADRHRLKKAFQSYWRNKELTADVDEGIIEIEEAVTMFEGIDSPDEDYDRMDQSVDPALSSSRLCEGMFVRALNKDYHKRYLHMQIVIDPWSPGGYRIESPFDQSDIDAQYFLREMQWMSSSGDVLAGNTLLNDLLIGEIRKVIPYYGGQIKDFETFILGKLYKLYAL